MCFLLTLVCLFVTVIVWANTSVDIWVLPMLVGVVTWLAAFYYWAMSKNRSGWWTLTGIAALIGLAIMIIIKDRSGEIQGDKAASGEVDTGTPIR
jgi:hypothetical protein